MEVKKKFYFKNHRSGDALDKDYNNKYLVLDIALRLEYYRMDAFKRRLTGIGTLMGAISKISNGISDWIGERQIISVIECLSSALNKNNNLGTIDRKSVV